MDQTLPVYLGVDVGTSSLKLVLMDERLTVIAKQSVPLSVSRPAPLWSEQRPEDWWQAFVKGMTALKSQHAPALSRLQAIGLSGQQHGAVLLDERGHVLRPAILWNDGRSFKECADLEQAVPNFADITGNKVMPGFTAPKLLWVYRHEPSIFAKVAKVLLPKDYLRFCLSGDYASDLSDSAGTSWLDTGKRTWSNAMLAATHLNTDHMPKLFEGNEITGVILAEIAQNLGLPQGVKLIAGAGDNAASAISMNVIESGKAFLSLGTSGVYFVARDRYQPNAAGGLHTFCHALPNHWHHMAVHLNAASAFDWWAKTLQQSPADLMAQLGKRRKKNRQPPLFLPYLSGERTPFNDPHAKGAFIGLSHETNALDMSLAVLEGITLAFASGQKAMEDADIQVQDISVVGGGARFPLFGTLLASALNRPLLYRKHREVGAAYGAAILALLGFQKLAAQDILTDPEIDWVAAPTPALRDYFAARYPLFIETYQRLKPIFPHFS